MIWYIQLAAAAVMVVVVFIGICVINKIKKAICEAMLEEHLAHTNIKNLIWELRREIRGVDRE